MPSPAATLLDVPAATIAALLIAGALRWAYGAGPGSDHCRKLPLAALVVALAAFVVWRILRLQDGVLTVLDVTAGILCGLLLMRAIKAAWADGPFEKMPRGLENTPMGVLLVAGLMTLGLLAFSFGCVGNVLWVCKSDGSRYWAWSYTEPLPPEGLRVETLPPGNWQ